jgi:hypothetical protein
MPSAIIPTTLATGMRSPPVHGTPPICRGSTVDAIHHATVPVGSAAAGRFRGASAMVDRYTEWADWAGWADEPADRRPRQGTGTDSADGNHNLAKVRVAGSNPVVRSL